MITIIIIISYDVVAHMYRMYVCVYVCVYMYVCMCVEECVCGCVV